MNMKPLRKYSNEQISESKPGILNTRYELQPYDWKSFKKIALKNKNISFLVHPEDSDVEFLYDSRTRDILMRYEGLDVEAWTDIPRGDLFKIIRGDVKLLDKYIK